MTFTRNSPFRTLGDTSYDYWHYTILGVGGDPDLASRAAYDAASPLPVSSHVLGWRKRLKVFRVHTQFVFAFVVKMGSIWLWAMHRLPKELVRQMPFSVEVQTSITQRGATKPIPTPGYHVNFEFEDRRRALSVVTMQEGSLYRELGRNRNNAATPTSTQKFSLWRQWLCLAILMPLNVSERLALGDTVSGSGSYLGFASTSAKAIATQVTISLRHCLISFTDRVVRRARSVSALPGFSLPKLYHWSAA